MGTPYIALYPSDYLADTAHLGLTEHGIYWRMLLHYYQHCKPFPNDLEKINRVIIAVTPEEKRVTEYILGEYFILRTYENGVSYWHHARADWEISTAEARHLSAVERGKKGGRPKAQHNLSFNSAKAELNLSFTSAKAEPKQPEPEPEPEPKEEKTKTHTRFSAREYLMKKGVSEEEATDWLRVRKEKKLTATRAAIDAIEKEAIVGNIDLPKAIHYCCENAWAGFKNSWLEKIKTDSPVDLSIFKD